MATFSMIVLRFLSALVIIFQCSLAIRNINIYPKYYFEDFCTDNENITYELSQTDRYSFAKIGAVHPTNVHFGGRNCTIVVKPPHGYSVYLQIKSFWFAFPHDKRSDCTSYIQVSANGTMSDKLCGSLDSLPSTSFTTNGNMSILLHTENNFLSRLGFALIVTAYKTSPCFGNDYFLCGNDRCIWQGLRCDSIDNCGDSSDEMDLGTSQCQVLDIINGGTKLSEVEKIGASKDLLRRLYIPRDEKFFTEARNSAEIIHDEVDEGQKYLQYVDIHPFTIEPIDFNFDITYPTSDIVSFRSSHNISLGAAVASAIFVILGAFIRFYCYYHCNQARRRQVLSAVTIIRTRSVLRQPSMNNAAPPPYETLVNDPEVHPESPPEYTAVSIPPCPVTQSTDIPNRADANKNADVSCGPPPPYEP